ncbi:ISxac3 transposase [Xanthomonas fragariae]|uniref:ISxac3 transposase n=1 Tax=Xanthomonas fragariae TaxID=48664 RepID=A0A1Y6HKP4_9XANT|nr:ISxac3 transposase [Xanthomonas fragariae]SMQ98598.1 hypothetical protein PD885_01347 [Xanthomonas fragariae]SMR03937.1 ISxac3 transposase [Xanthomonas fragariae]
MSSKRYTDEFKIEAVQQANDRGFKVAEVAERLWGSPCTACTPGCTGSASLAWCSAPRFGV